jgi:hypothetical protein
MVCGEEPSRGSVSEAGQQKSRLAYQRLDPFSSGFTQGLSSARRQEPKLYLAMLVPTAREELGLYRFYL